MNSLDRIVVTLERDGVVLGRTTLGGLVSASWHAHSIMHGALAGVQDAVELINRTLDEVHNPKAPRDEHNKSVMMGFLWFLAMSSMKPPSVAAQREQDTIDSPPQTEAA